jgi:hypothetical protein
MDREERERERESWRRDETDRQTHRHTGTWMRGKMEEV